MKKKQRPRISLVWLVVSTAGDENSVMQVYPTERQAKRGCEAYRIDTIAAHARIAALEAALAGWREIAELLTGRPDATPEECDAAHARVAAEDSARIAALAAERDALNPVCERSLDRIATLEVALREAREWVPIPPAAKLLAPVGGGS